MKKVIAILALASLMVACGGKGTSEGTTESTAVTADTTEVTVVDTTAAEAPVEQPAVE